MKEYVRNWFVKHKKLLITFAITSVLTFFLSFYELNLILSNLKELESYAATGIVTDNLKNVGLLGLFNLVVIVFWTLLLLMIVWYVIFPDFKTLKRTFYANELNFLVNIPSHVRREIDKK